MRQLLFRFIPPLIARQSPLWIDILEEHRVLHYFYLAVPGLLTATYSLLAPNLNPSLAIILYKAAIIYSIVMLTMGVISALRAYNDFYDQYYDFAKEVPIKTVIQTAVVLVVIFSILIIIAIFLDVPLLALAGVIMVIVSIAAYLFREPLLGFSASLQLSMNHMLAIGDWIEMDRFGANGVVEDINVTSTKIRNWDNAIVNIPTYTLIQNPFNNWKSMQSREARRIQQPIYIDQTSIAFLSQEQKSQKLAQIEELYETLTPEIRENSGFEGARPADLETRDQITNLELFMAYATQIIAGHPQTRADYSIYMRQQDPTPEGLPLETFFFTRATDFVPYHAVQREIFSHLLAVLPQFGLRPYQLIAGSR